MAGIPFYSIVPCCASSGTALSNFNFPGGGVLSMDGTYVYNGSTVTINGLTFTPGFCYTINVEGVSFTDYPDAPALTNFTLVTTCSDNECYDCETPIEKCYTLYPCSEDQEVLVTNDPSAALYVNQFATALGYPGCWYVVENEIGDCVGAQDIRVTQELPCACVLNCYIITGTPTSVIYVNELDVLVVASGGGNYCSKIAPVVSGGYVGDVYNIGACVNGVCPEFCFLLTSCTEPIVTLEANLSPSLLEAFTGNKVIKINGYDQCWTISQTQACDCSIDVTVLQTYDTCIACLPNIAYKFINCNNPAIIKYSTADFSAYVGKSVELDCGDCWIVEQIDYIPPSTSVINVLFTFDNCTACNRTYYKLTDCTNLSNVQYTYTNLSSYLGKVIKVENCDACFEIEETRLPINPGIVTVTESFDDCIDCGAIAPCICTTIKNYDVIDHTYTYIDCEGVLQTLTLTPGEKSDKTCMRGFVGDKLCNCIELTINGLPVTAVLQPNQINGKPTWNFIYNTLTYSIVYDVNEGWQITSSSVTGIVAELNNPMLSCPNGPWTVVSNSVLDLSLFLDNGTLVLNGILIYDSELDGYTGNIEVNGNTYTFLLKVTYFNECNGIWQLAYWNTDLKEPEWTFVAGFPADCTCLNGTYTDVTPNNLYIEINSICTVNTVDCSVGYAPFVPSATDDIEEYGDCSLVGNTCYTYVIQIPPLLVSETLYYKNCKGDEVSVPLISTKSGYEYVICGINNQTANDIYITGSFSISFSKTVICSEQAYACPPPVYPKRPVIPGYNVPSCDPEKYEKFACKSSEILYKIVLEKRYGITNCCPDTDLGQRWIVKKELADLQGAVDPNYICTPAASCCNNTPTCGCGCNSAPKTCNSR